MKATPLSALASVSPRAQRYVSAVEDGDSNAVQSFAEHMSEEGLLGAGSAELPIELTVAHLVERYIQTADGMAELKAWAQMLDEEIRLNSAA